MTHVFNVREMATHEVSLDNVLKVFEQRKESLAGKLSSMIPDYNFITHPDIQLFSPRFFRMLLVVSRRSRMEWSVSKIFLVDISLQRTFLFLLVSFILQSRYSDYAGKEHPIQGEGKTVDSRAPP